MNLFEIFNELIHGNIFSVLGLLIAVTFLGSKIFQRVGFPQVVGFILIGVLHGPSFLNVVPLELVDQLTFVSEIALGLIGSETPSAIEILELPVIEIGGSLVVGIATGLILDFILRRMGSHHDGMAISIASVFICVGLTESLGFSLILATMVMGLVVANRDPEHSLHIRYTIEQAGPVIYVLFFALVGARFQLDLLPAMGLLGVTSVVLRSLGKFAGAWLGGRFGGAEPTVRNNLLRYSHLHGES